MSRAPRPRFPVPVLIETSAALAALVARLRTEPYVTVDTEFMRERTFWPELCVVQLGGAEEVAVIDALATDLDLAPLGELFADQNVLKVFHAARQDIEICVLRWGAVPTPLFDTQVAGMVAGFGDQAGYDTLVQQLTGGQIHKAHRFSDWSARPLSPAQLAYAAADVTWLRLVYERLRERLEADRRLEWVTQEMAILTDPATYRTEPEDAWQRLRPRSTNRRFLGMVRALAAWREREAQRINIPRQRVLKDETLLELAATAPDTPEGLARARHHPRLRRGPRRHRAAGGDRRRARRTRGRPAASAARPGILGTPVAGAGGAAQGAAGGLLRTPSRGAETGRAVRRSGPSGDGSG